MMMRQTGVFASSANLTVMCNAAFKAARGLIRDFGEVENLQVSRKGPGDFVSSADKKAEQVIYKELKKARSNNGFLMEESEEEKSDSGFRFIIDPLDGTTNFLHGIPHFAISIALEKNGEVIAGVIFDPIKDEMFIAEKGFGAYCNDRRIRVSGRKDITQTLLATGIPFAMHSKKEMETFQRSINVMMPKVAGIRRFGAASLDLAYVAAGRYDAYWESALQPWDVAAGLLIVKEAGGYVTDLQGGDKVLEKGTILASNSKLHGGLLKELKPLYAKE